MIEELKSHWPVIAQYPWEFIWAFCSGVGVGWGAPAVWRWLFPLPTGAAPEPGLLKKLWAWITAFRPNDLQKECIKVLREFDNLYLTAEQIAHAVNKVNPTTAYPISDVIQALEQLTKEEWARGDIRLSPGRWQPGTMENAYQLWGRGLDFARKKKYPVHKPGDV